MSPFATYEGNVYLDILEFLNYVYNGKKWKAENYVLNTILFGYIALILLFYKDLLYFH